MRSTALSPTRFGRRSWRWPTKRYRDYRDDSRAETHNKSAAYFDRTFAPSPPNRTAHRSHRPQPRRQMHQGEAHRPTKLARFEWPLLGTLCQFLDAAAPESPPYPEDTAAESKAKNSECRSPRASWSPDAGWPRSRPLRAPRRPETYGSPAGRPSPKSWSTTRRGREAGSSLRQPRCEARLAAPRH